jgi:hypothetical protein
LDKITQPASAGFFFAQSKVTCFAFKSLKPALFLTACITYCNTRQLLLHKTLFSTKDQTMLKLQSRTDAYSYLTRLAELSSGIQLLIFDPKNLPDKCVSG